MSKYDDKTFKAYKEKTEQRLPIAKGAEIKEFPVEFKNMSTEEIKKLLYLNKDETFSFDFFNNKQEYVTEDYLKNLKKFDNKMAQEDKLLYLFDFMKEAYGVMTPALLKKCFETSFGFRDPTLTLQDYEDMIQDNFGKKQIDLNNPEDKERFKLAFLTGESIALQNEMELQKENKKEEAEDLNKLLPSAIKDSIHIQQQEDHKDRVIEGRGILLEDI